MQRMLIATGVALFLAGCGLLHRPATTYPPAPHHEPDTGQFPQN